ncbi:endonuclease/exonuclease/phosphatase family protein [Dyadobacter psychrotolerans]|uniref:Endonuclease/exonuclease/phosphatase family protein n=1 Tax=Dyadobacter psychrotolerans TaxID=2541721 RepID=A0A4R5DJF5_9BACT|nr:endonuclease/exonuclease/phosphatase family protein [Dyadobacter psychrotolerans]TDE12120.1 endonuclease/exonuclease/phosphatase family protein [Dyadobacter psychrotolerans]
MTFFTKFSKVRLLLFFIAVLFAGEVAAQDLRVMSYNVRYKNSIDSINGWEYRKGNVAGLVKYHKVDIFGTQEANWDQLGDMEKSLPEYKWYGIPRVAGKNGEFTAIFYLKDRFTLLDSGTFWYSETPYVKESKSWDAFYPRIASWCKLKDKKTGTVFFFFNTHFDHRGSIAKEKSAEILRSQIDSIAKKMPVIVTGDFNSIDTSTPYKTMVAGGTLKDALHISEMPHYGPVNTSSGFAVSNKPIPGRIDYIFVNDKVKVLQHATITDQQEGRYYSDHLPVISEVKILK